MNLNTEIWKTQFLHPVFEKAIFGKLANNWTQKKQKW